MKIAEDAGMEIDRRNVLLGEEIEKMSSEALRERLLRRKFALSLNQNRN